MDAKTILTNKLALIAASGLSALVLGAAVAAVSRQDTSAAGKPSPTAAATVPATAAATTTASASPFAVGPRGELLSGASGAPSAAADGKKEAIPFPPEQKTLPAGQKIEAASVRVATDDGSCLNVRPQPGTTFGTEPFSCLADDTLLWLYGPAKQVDGESWRYALGAGWIAARYTKPVAPPKVRLPASPSVTLWSQASDGKSYGTQVSARKVDLKTLAASPAVSFPHVEWGIGGRSPEVSPSGEYIAMSNNGTPDGSRTDAVVLVGRIADGSQVDIPDAYPGQWSSGNKLLLTTGISSCNQGQCKSAIAYYDPATGTTKRLTEPSAEGGAAAWSSDGKAIFVLARRTLTRVPLDGTATVVTDAYPENLGFYEAVNAPNGAQFLLGGGYGPLNLLDARTGKVVEFVRAPQRQIGGKCGGTFSRSSGWIDDTHIFYHERSSSSREDGITIGDLRTGARKVLPFFNVADLSSPAPGLLSFSTWAGYDDLNFSVTFIMDIATGDSMPVLTGAGAAWTR